MGSGRELGVTPGDNAFLLSGLCFLSWSALPRWSRGFLGCHPHPHTLLHPAGFAAEDGGIADALDIHRLQFIMRVLSTVKLSEAKLLIETPHDSDRIQRTINMINNALPFQR